MKNIARFIKSFYSDEEGITSIEYGLIAALVALAVVTAATALGLELDTTFDAITADLVAARTP